MVVLAEKRSMTNQQQHTNDSKEVFGGEDNGVSKMGSFEQPLPIRNSSDDNDGHGVSTLLGGGGAVEECRELNTPKIGDLPPLSSQSSRGIDGIFRGSNPKSTTSTTTTTATPSSWSNIVSSSNSSTLSPGSPSSETLLTSNNNMSLLTNTNRSQSFETSSLDYYNNNNNIKDTISAATAPSYSHQHYHYHHSSLSQSTTTGGGAGMNMMYPATPYLEYKPRGDSISSWEDSTTLTGTDITSPMSSPSLSPHVSPAMHHLTATALLPSWQLSDGTNNNNNDYHHSPTPTSNAAANRMQQYPYHLQQSIPEENYDDESFEIHHQYTHRGSNTHNINYMNPPHTGGSSNRSSTGPLMSPPRHNTQHSTMLYPRSSGSSNRITSHPFTPPAAVAAATAATTTSHHRSTIEVLKTLLRKKACLYEPVTSYAISLVTWLVGYKLALLQGYFTRQQLQAGVHACVSKKIDAGYVTRTKVYRCMQVILNSCFHYIIPSPDDSSRVEDENGECCCNVGGGLAFRTVFANETTSNEEQLLLTLPKPWHDLNLESIDNAVCSSSVVGLFHHSDNEDDDNHHYHPYSVGGGGKHQASVGGKVDSSSSSTVSHADESLDSNKRSVLLCFNENIRCAADIFRCHNEFIRDVAHSGNLNLSSEEWLSFVTGTKAHTRSSGKSSRGGGGDTMLNDFYQYFHLAGDANDCMDQQGLAKIRTSWCAKRYEHDHSFCAFAHVDVNRGWLRRDPYIHTYAPQMCPNIKPLQSSSSGGGDGTNYEDCYMINMCPHGVMCNFAHSREEILYHPESYKRNLCRHAASTCPLGDICPNTHTEASSNYASHHGYNNSNNNNSRQGGGKRHYQDHAPFHSRTGGGTTYPGSKRRAASVGGTTMSSTSSVSGGFGKFPDASPMLYIDPAPLSEYEKTLVLPGLQALFRDHSSAMVYTTSTIINAGSWQFGYRKSNCIAHEPT